MGSIQDLPPICGSYPSPGPLRTEILLDLLCSLEGKEKGRWVQRLTIGCFFPTKLLPQLLAILSGRVPKLLSLELFQDHISQAVTNIFSMKDDNRPEHQPPKLQRISCTLPPSKDLLHLVATMRHTLNEFDWQPSYQNFRSDLDCPPLNPIEFRLRFLRLAPNALSSKLAFLPISSVEAVQISYTRYAPTSEQLKHCGDLMKPKALSIKNFLTMNVLLHIPICFPHLRYLQIQTDSVQVGLHMFMRIYLSPHLPITTTL